MDEIIELPIRGVKTYLKILAVLFALDLVMAIFITIWVMAQGDGFNAAIGYVFGFLVAGLVINLLRNPVIALVIYGILRLVDRYKYSTWETGVVSDDTLEVTT